MSETTTTLGAVLSITTGKLVAPLDEVYELQDFLVGRPLMTHERFQDAEPQIDYLLRLFPRLAEAEPPLTWERVNGSAEVHCRRWVAQVAAHIGWTTAVVPESDGREGGAA